MKTSEEVVQTVNESARGLYFIAGTSALVAIAGGFPLLLDAALIAGLAWWLQRKKSQWPALILLVLSLTGVVMAVMNLFGATQERRGNILISGLVVWLAWRAFWALRQSADHRTVSE